MEGNDKKNKYYGRYTESTGFYTAPNGKRYRMTFEEYLKFIEETRGLYAAHKIKQKAMRRQENRKKNNKVDLRNVNCTKLINPQYFEFMVGKNANYEELKCLVVTKEEAVIIENAIKLIEITNQINGSNEEERKYIDNAKNLVLSKFKN